MLLVHHGYRPLSSGANESEESARCVHVCACACVFCVWTYPSSLFSWMCAVDCACSYPSSSLCPSLSVSVCIRYLCQCVQCFPWFETAFLQSIRIKGLITLFSLCKKHIKAKPLHLIVADLPHVIKGALVSRHGFGRRTKSCISHLIQHATQVAGFFCQTWFYWFPM